MNRLTESIRLKFIVKDNIIQPSSHPISGMLIDFIEYDSFQHSTTIYYLAIFVEHIRHAKACLLVSGVFGVNKTTDFIV